MLGVILIWCCVCASGAGVTTAAMTRNQPAAAPPLSEVDSNATIIAMIANTQTASAPLSTVTSAATSTFTPTVTSINSLAASPTATLVPTQTQITTLQPEPGSGPPAASTSAPASPPAPGSSPRPTATLVVAPTQDDADSDGDIPLDGEGPCDCSADLYDCSDFPDQASAQTCYEFCIALDAGDIHALDGDNNDLACQE
jgi:hypothetical protein